ncbi:MAG: hypothetical protein M0009_11585 [Deltaproteobacteria bacterium]|nr:hypothetical protein [Deltaproteobacteria bacterium]
MNAKKVMMVILLSLLLFGCGAAARQSEFNQHNSMYQSWDHLKYSWWGYKHTTVEDAKKSQDQGWWGKEQVIVAPGQ